MSEYKRVTIDKIQPNLKTFSLKIETVFDSSRGTIVIDSWRRAYSPGQINKLENDLNVFAQNSNAEEILDVVRTMWTEQVIADYQSSLNQE